MVYISFPRIDLNDHVNLVAWRANLTKKVGDWTDLKNFLAEQPRFLKIHSLPKCWYTELPQGDDYALDVEHFRPKKAAKPLTVSKIKVIEKKLGYKFTQSNTTGAYPWLEFEYRNYRLTSALPNRGGGKHVYFPVAGSTTRLTTGEEPWSQTEYPMLLDPSNPNDAKQLIVLPSGVIVPKATQEKISSADYATITAIWSTGRVYYLRAIVSIELYRLNHRILVAARKEKFEDTISAIDTLVLAVAEKSSENLQNRLIAPLIHSILPSAPFSLAARSAMNAYVFNPALDSTVVESVKECFKTILDRLDQFTADRRIDWNQV